MDTFTCTYGSEKTPDVVYFYKGWYVVDDSINVNRTNTELFDGIDVEDIEDYDTFSWSSPITSLDDLIEAVDS